MMIVLWDVWSLAIHRVCWMTGGHTHFIAILSWLVQEKSTVYHIIIHSWLVGWLGSINYMDHHIYQMSHGTGLFYMNICNATCVI